MATKKKATANKQAGAQKKVRRRRGVKLEPTQLAADELKVEAPPPELEPLLAQVTAAGGSVLAVYREPLGGRHLALVSLPVDRVSPTPFQRDVSDSHVRKLIRAMDKTRRFLDPLIIVRQGDAFQTPNGNHRLTALRELGARAVIGLLVPEADVAYQILALNIEKAHNLRERALEVARMYRELARFTNEPEPTFELEFEEPSLISLGFAYEQRGRLAGGAYHPSLRKVDAFLNLPLPEALSERERRAGSLLELDDAVNEAVAKLKEKGLQSPYLKSFVVARINPLRFIKGEPPAFDELIETMTRRARSFKADKINPQDLARSGGPIDED